MATKQRTKSQAPKAKRAVKKATRRAAARPARRATSKPRSSAPKNTSRDAIAELKRDHREVEQLFKRFEKAGDTAYRTKRHLVDAMLEALSRHAAIEELVFYPALRREAPRLESEVLESLEEHHLAKVALREIEDLDPKSERFTPKVSVMIDSVRRHVRREESDVFPVARARLDRHQLSELGDALRRARPTAPTRPHPSTPDEPPGNVVVGGAVAVIDRARAVGKRAVKKAREELPKV